MEAAAVREGPWDSLGRHSVQAQFEQQNDPVGYQRREIGALRSRSQRDAMAAATAVEALRGMAIEGLTGNTMLRLLGVGFIVLGIVVSLGGNLGAL
jgi:hypothetical protein